MHIKFTLLLFACLLTSISFGQERHIQLTKAKSGKTKVIQEHKRVKIKTFDGQKYIGNLVIVDSQTVMVDGTEIALADIVRIKRKSHTAFVTSIVLYTISALFIAVGTVGLIEGGYGVIAAIAGYPAAVLFAGLGALINDYPVNNPNSKWTYKVVMNE